MVIMERTAMMSARIVRDHNVGRIARYKGKLVRIESRWWLSKREDNAYVILDGSDKKRIVDLKDLEIL